MPATPIPTHTVTVILVNDEKHTWNLTYAQSETFRKSVFTQGVKISIREDVHEQVSPLFIKTVLISKIPVVNPAPTPTLQ
jgi:exonuclease I